LLQALYGPRGTKLPDLCSDSSFDAIFEYPAGVIYILKGTTSALSLLSHLMILHERYILCIVSHEMSDVQVLFVYSS
jgi:hypothetical protein